MLIFLALLAFYVAWNLGANDVANSMGTSVGSKAVTLRQALIIAGVLEFSGAVLFGRKVSETLATQVADPALFADRPSAFILGMISVLLSAGLGLQLATRFGLPVSSSHGVVGAIAGFSWLAAGIDSVNWGSIGTISLGWVLTPVVSGIIAGLFYALLQWGVLQKEDPQLYLEEWIPWLSGALVVVFGTIVLPTITAPVVGFLQQSWDVSLPLQDLPLLIGAVAIFGLTAIGWRSLQTSSRPLVERPFARFQVVSACFVAFAHGSNDVGNAIAPFAAIVYILNTGMVPLEGFNIPLWVLILGGTGIVFGLAVWGKNVISTIGEKIIPLQPSGGFCAELATATTVLVASKLGLPVSTSHALVGAVVGIGIAQDWKSVRWQTLQGILLAWVITIPFCTLLSAGIFALLERFAGVSLFHPV